MITQLTNLNMDLYKRYYNFMMNGYERTLREIRGMPIDVKLAVGLKVKGEPVANVGPLLRTITDRIELRRDFMNSELTTMKSLVGYVASVDESVIDMDFLNESVLKLMYTYEDFMPLQLDTNTYTLLIQNREKMMCLMRGIELPVRSSEFELCDVDLESLFIQVAMANNWPALVVPLKRGIRAYSKRKRVALLGFIDHITLIRLKMMEHNTVSSLVDQTAYDLHAEGFKFEPTTESSIEEIVTVLSTDICDDIGDHFKGSLEPVELALGLLEMVKMMGVEDVCLIHHFSE